MTLSTAAPTPLTLVPAAVAPPSVAPAAQTPAQRLRLKQEDLSQDAEQVLLDLNAKLSDVVSEARELSLLDRTYSDATRDVLRQIVAYHAGLTDALSRKTTKG